MPPCSPTQAPAAAGKPPWGGRAELGPSRWEAQRQVVRAWWELSHISCTCSRFLPGSVRQHSDTSSWLGFVCVCAHETVSVSLMLEKQRLFSWEFGYGFFFACGLGCNFFRFNSTLYCAPLIMFEFAKWLKHTWFYTRPLDKASERGGLWLLCMTLFRKKKTETRPGVLFSKSLHPSCRQLHFSSAGERDAGCQKVGALGEV